MTHLYFFVDAEGNRKGIAFALCEDHAKTQKIPSGMFLKHGVVSAAACDACLAQSYLPPEKCCLPTKGHYDRQ